MSRIEELIKEDIIDAISKYEPRITVTTNDIVIEENINVLNIYIQYEIKETGEINSYNMNIAADDNPDKI